MHGLDGTVARTGLPPATVKRHVRALWDLSALASRSASCGVDLPPSLRATFAC